MNRSGSGHLEKTQSSVSMLVPPQHCSHNMSAGFLQSKWFQKSEYVQDRASAFAILISEVTSHHFCHILLFRSWSLGPVHNHGAGTAQGPNARRQGSQGPSQRLQNRSYQWWSKDSSQRLSHSLRTIVVPPAVPFHRAPVGLMIQALISATYPGFSWDLQLLPPRMLSSVDRSSQLPLIWEGDQREAKLSAATPRVIFGFPEL